MPTPFRHAFSSAPEWEGAVAECLETLGDKPATLGFVYATDYFANRMPEIVEALKTRSGIAHWTGTVGIGISVSGREVMNAPGLALMAADLARDSFRMIPPIATEEEASTVGMQLPGDVPPSFAVVHGDPRNPDMGEIIETLAARTETGFLVGGLTSSRFREVQVADEVVEGGLSGVAFGNTVAIATRLTQGVTPVGPRHEVTESQDNIVLRLDGRPALDVLFEDIGEVLARDLERAAGYIFAAIAVKGSDTGDYLVRPLVGVDPQNRLVAIGESVKPGDQILFCRRDQRSAREDMDRMLGALKATVPAPPRGALYFSCLGRGESLFGPDSAELGKIRDTFGDLPLVGFFANGEISHDRLYGYTGVLTLFL